MSQPAFDFGDVELDDPTNPTYTVGELAEAINDQLRQGFRDGVWVRGEIDGLRHAGPHTYFSLVEHGDGGKAVLNVQLFAPMKRKLTPILRKHRLELRDGMKVRIHGHLDFWAPNGRLGLKMAGLDPRYTLGEIAQSRDEVMRRLVASGLIDANRRRPLSAVPLRVGVVASIESAAWHDLHDELVRSGFGFRLVVADTRVQGEFATRMVAGAIGTLARRRDLDVIVVVRGGGARNELAVFDDEVIARTIAASPVPVFTGLGHEIDRSVADEVAHTALKTPTACAGELIDRVAAYSLATERAFAAVLTAAGERLGASATGLRDVAHRIARRTHAAVERADERLHQRVHRLGVLAPTALSHAAQRVDEASVRLGERATHATAREADRLGDRAARLTARAGSVVEREASRLDVLAARVGAVDPAVQLARGWSITRRSDGSVVRSSAEVAPGDVLLSTLIDGSVTSTVDAVHPGHAGQQPNESEEPDG